MSKKNSINQRVESIKKLEKWKFKEVIMPRVTYWMILISMGFMLGGAAMNFIVVSENDGKMPVWDDYFYNTPSHFTITNISEVSHLPLSDIYHYWGIIWSIGDFFMIFGLSLFVLAQIINSYNSYLNKKIKRLKNGK